MTTEIGFGLNPASATRSVKTQHRTDFDLSSAQLRGSASPEKKPAENSESTTREMFELQSKVTELNQSVQQLQHELRFNIDDDSGRVVVKVIDAETGDTIRQIPPETMLALARHLTEGEDIGGSLLEVIA